MYDTILNFCNTHYYGLVDVLLFSLIVLLVFWLDQPCKGCQDGTCKIPYDGY